MNAEDLVITLKKNMAKLSKSERRRAIESVRDIIRAAMPSNIPATTIRIEPEVKREASAILDELGLSMSTAMNMFLRAVIREGGMPFEMKVNKPNE